MLSVAEASRRRALVAELAEIDRAKKDWLRSQILEHRRMDILSEVVLGLQLQPFHKAMQRFILRNPLSLQLAFRGAGKTTTVTVAYAIDRILRNRDVRILIVSKTHTFAKKILREIKQHLETNEVLIELFGEFVGDKWHESEIEVKGRSRPMKEGTITTVGADGQVAGGHYDVILVDDLVDGKNSRTRYMREVMRAFVDSELMPTLEPGGEVHYLGTRYHYDDQYGHMAEGELANAVQVIPALKRIEVAPGVFEERSPWESKHAAKDLKKIRASRGKIAFDSQYQCSTDAMKGEIFEYDYMIEVERTDVPEDARHYVGVDLAISEKESADMFAMVHIAVKGRIIWIIEVFEGQLSFSEQVRKILAWHNKIDPVRFGIESNAYQAALAGYLTDKSDSIRVRRLYTKEDKVTRMWKLQPRFEAEEVRIVKGNGVLIDHLVALPGGRYRDLFDALDLAVKASVAKKERRGGRRGAVGLI